MIKPYSVLDKHLGKRYDGHKSPLADPVVLCVPEQAGGVLDTSEPFNLSKPERWIEQVQAAYDAIRLGKRDTITKINAWVEVFLKKEGVSLEEILCWSENRRRKMCNRLVAAAQREMKRRDDEILRKIVSADTKIASLRNEDTLLNGMMKLPDTYLENGNTVKKMFDIEKRRDSQLARNALFQRLKLWALGPLVLERPQGSSLHHLIDYDLRQGHHEPDAVVPGKLRDAQIVLVENDWGAAVPEMDGEWRVPFEYISWEFRISGVRVLAVTESVLSKRDNTEHARMWCVYGANGHWVADDYGYDLGRPTLPAGTPIDRNTTMEFRRVARMCYDTIRATCIMLDAQVAHHEHVAVSPKLKERRQREGRAALRDHYVVRLLHAETRAYNQRARSAGAGTSGPRAAQRGHWRKATWVHYDDQDSGQVQYANEGGFVVSKTWRRWHFAGDPRNIIHKEYRL